MTETLARPIEAEARIRAKNQVTLPDRIAKAMDAHQDDVLIFETDPGKPGVAIVHLVRRGFAGALTGTYGTSEDVKAFLREEHAAWGE
jgi:bifunctional DNA-binding transcriptional regulator/antitoxin component of YhaV-PrlF toxin-antitoxin module